MKIEKIDVPETDPVESLYSVGEMSSEDIGAPSEQFLSVVREIDALSSINTFTIKEFINQVKGRFSGT